MAPPSPRPLSRGSPRVARGGARGVNESAASATRNAATPSWAVQGLGTSPRATATKVDEFSSIGRLEADEEVLPRRPGRRGDARLDRAHRGARPEADADGIARAEQLGPDVVAERIVARDGQHGQRTARQAQRRDGRVDVAVLREDREAQDAAVGIDLLDLLSGQPAKDIEVVDGEIAEQAARLGDVALVRRRRVVAGQPDGVQRAELAALDQTARLAVAGVEAALEAELERDAAALDLGRERDRGVEVARPAASRRTSACRRRCEARISSAWADVAAAMTAASAVAMRRRRWTVAAATRSRRRPRRRAPGRRRRRRPRRCPGCRAAAARAAGRCARRPAARPSCATASRRARCARDCARPGDAAPRRARVGRSRRSPTAVPSCCPARPSASRRSRAR